VTRFTWSAIKELLDKHYSAPLEQTFKQFRAGVIFFTVGLIIIYLANTAMPQSAKQELIILLGLIITGCGFMVAMLAHIRMIISRAVKFLKK